MRSKVQEGFHRIGLIVAGLFGAAGAFTLTLTLLSLTGVLSQDGMHVLAIYSGALAVLAALSYAAARAVGWIVDGFVG